MYLVTPYGGADMANHPRRNWRKQWTVDLDAGTARHESGITARFPDPANPDRASLDDAETLRASLAAQHGAAAGAQVLARTLRDAVDVYTRALTHARTVH